MVAAPNNPIPPDSQSPGRSQSHNLALPADALIADTLDRWGQFRILLDCQGSRPSACVLRSVNQPFCRATGRDAAELIGRGLDLFIGPDTDPAPFAAIAEAAHAGRPHRCELAFTSVTGRTFWAGIHLMPISERPGLFLGLGEDVTAAVEARTQQAATQSLLAQVFLTIDSAVAIAGSDGRLLMTNPFTDRFLGYPPRSLTGRSAFDLVAPEAYEAAFAAWERQMEDGGDYEMDLMLVRADGTRVPARMHASVVETPDRRRFRIITARPPSVPAEPAVPGRLLASRIRLAGIEAARATLGERWPATAQRAAALALQVLRQRSGPRDTVTRITDVDFVILPESTTEADVAWRSAMIAQDIRRTLIGSGETAVSAHVTALTGYVPVSDNPAGKRDELAGHALSARAAALEDTARASLRSLLPALHGIIEPIHRSDAPWDAPWGAFVALPQADERRIQVALTALPLQEAQELDLDARLLDLAADRLSDPDLPRGHRLLVPVSFDLFDNRPALDRYVTAGRLLDRAVRPRLVLVLTDMPAAIPRARLTDCIIRLRPYCGMIALAVDGPDNVPPDLSLCGAPLVVMDTAAVDPARLTELLAQLRMSRTQLLVRRAATVADAKALLAAGVDLVSVRPPEAAET